MISYRTNPTMPKPMHAADATDRAKIASATGYTTSMFLGRGQWDKHPSPGLERAREVRRQMMADADYAKSGRVPLIYAMLPDGSEVLVPDDYQVGELPGENATADHVEMAAKPLVTPAPDAGKASVAVALKDGMKLATSDILDLGPVADAMAALAAFPGLKKLSQRHLDMLESARAGVLPTPPDFSADTHKNYRAKMKRCTDAIAAGDVAALEAIDIKPVCSSSTPMARFRNLAVIALKARAGHRGTP